MYVESVGTLILFWNRLIGIVRALSNPLNARSILLQFDVLSYLPF